MPVVSVQMLNLCFFDDPLTIKLFVNEIPKASIIDYNIMNAFDKEIANGSTTLAFLNTETNRPVKCPQALLEIIESL